VVLAVKVSVAQPSFMNALRYYGAFKLIAPAAATRHWWMITIYLVGHVKAVIVTVTPPSHFHAATVVTRELSPTLTCHWRCRQTACKRLPYILTYKSQNLWPNLDQKVGRATYARVMHESPSETVSHFPSAPLAANRAAASTHTQLIALRRVDDACRRPCSR